MDYHNGSPLSLDANPSLADAVACDLHGTRIEVRAYRRGRTQSGDFGEFRYPSQVDENGIELEHRRSEFLDAIRRRLAKILPCEEQAEFLLSIYPVGEIAFRELARQTGLSASTWKRRVDRVIERLRSDDKLRDLADRSEP